MRCRWCRNEAVTRVELEPLAEGRAYPIYAEVCEDHREILADQPTSVDSLRRKHARDVPQLSIFDLPGVSPASAIQV